MNRDQRFRGVVWIAGCGRKCVFLGCKQDNDVIKIPSKFLEVFFSFFFLEIIWFPPLLRLLQDLKA